MGLGHCRRCGDFEGSCKCGKGNVLLNSQKRERVSKFLSGLLRHFPDKFGLRVDENGWAKVDDVVKVLKSRYGVGKKQIELIAKFDRKRRFEIKDGRIRARYGHSIVVNTDWTESSDIPERLYHATSPANLGKILKEGLKPMKRREVHMCATPDEAVEVGRRHAKNPVLIEIDAKRAVRSGIRIRKKGEVYTADHIPPEFLRAKEIQVVNKEISLQ